MTFQREMPWCEHPEWPGANAKPALTRMTGCCPNNCCCPACGFGWGGIPHTCKPESGAERQETPHD